MSNTDQVLNDVTYHINDKAITSQTLANLGYETTTNSVIVRTTTKKGKTTTFSIFEVVDEKNEPRDFCFMFNLDTQLGIILPYPFSRYENLKVGATNK